MKKFTVKQCLKVIFPVNFCIIYSTWLRISHSNFLLSFSKIASLISNGDRLTLHSLNMDTQTAHLA